MQRKEKKTKAKNRIKRVEISGKGIHDNLISAKQTQATLGEKVSAEQPSSEFC